MLFLLFFRPSLPANDEQIQTLGLPVGAWVLGRVGSKVKGLGFWVYFSGLRGLRVECE